jgi:phosphoribosylamine---glycine ligase
LSSPISVATPTRPRSILVVGSGAREHALCWRLSKEPGVERVYAAPGNLLMPAAAEVHSEVAADDHLGIVALARSVAADLVVVGPEAPLVGGLADRLSESGIPCFGPSAAAAKLEGSKSFCREVCRAAGVQMADGRSFADISAALAFGRRMGAPLVVKADGLAAGKGVAICMSLDEVEWHIRAALETGRFGKAGRRVVIERYLEGREASVIALCDGDRGLVLPSARDHKRLGDADAGPNTGGMGAYSPVEELDRAALEGIYESFHRPVLTEMARRGTPFRGALFAGLMLTADGPRLLEFNARFGDPETQAILPLLERSLSFASLLAAAATGDLARAARDQAIDGLALLAEPGATVAITLAASGYPDAPRSGDAIEGIVAAQAAGALVFGAGVSEGRDSSLITSGGRVLTVVARGADVGSAAKAAYAAAGEITFAGRQMRHDIGRRRVAVGAAA